MLSLIPILPAPRFDTWPGRNCVTWLEPRIQPLPPKPNLIRVKVRATDLYTTLYVPGTPVLLLNEPGGPLSQLCARVWEHCLEHDVNPASAYDLALLDFWLEHFADKLPPLA